MLLDNLIKTKDDVEILSQNGVLDYWLNVEEATKFFNKLYTDTYVKAYYYLELTDEVDKYCKRWWPKNRTVLSRDYFNYPGASFSVGVATFFLICAFLQTFFTISK
ncbi:hypothetical protein TIFTF001_050746 [Ficus carica]|uniref:Uncharacterized protein n=1 Tax=Ficus carica TaxID=3494 RepID=A0AA87ZH18_FICCA|nr:hypothetical protein TIFTF001_050746 [Ficus carica]